MRAEDTINTFSRNASSGPGLVSAGMTVPKRRLPDFFCNDLPDAQTKKYYVPSSFKPHSK